MQLLSKSSDIEELEKRLRVSAGFSTNNLTISTIVDISNEIPANVNAINPSYAEYLAGRFLQGMSLAGDLFAIAIQHEDRMETQKKTAYASAMLTKAPAAGAVRQKDAEQFAFTDITYINACDKTSDAKAFRIMLAQKAKTFEKAHHHMRKIAEQHRDDLEGGQEGFKSEDPLMNNDWDSALKI